MAGDGEGRLGMERAREISYEVQAQDDGCWVIDSMHGHKNSALAAA